MLASCYKSSVRQSVLRRTSTASLGPRVRQKRLRFMTTSSSSPHEPMPSLWQTLVLAVTAGRAPSDGFQSYASSTHKFVLTQGFAYLAAGSLSVVVPALVADVLLIPSPAAHDLAWFRLLGVALATIGYCYIQSARQIDIAACVIHTTFNRLTFVPLMLLYAFFVGSLPQVCIAFGVMDPMLAILTHYVWVHDKKKEN